MSMLEPCLGKIEIGNPMDFRNLTLVPLVGEVPNTIRYLLSVDAINKHLLEVTETTHQGTVSELLVKNLAEEMVLLLDGEELVGAKQNRIVNTTVLLAAKSETKIKVSCVERGRWREVGKIFTHGNYAPSSMRASKSKAVTRNLVASGVADADQGEVWESVANYARANNVDSSTEAMHDIYEKKQIDIESMARQFKYQKGMRGCMVAINGKFVASDVFDKSETLKSIWERLLMGYVLDAISKTGQIDKPFGITEAEELLKNIVSQDCIACPSVGMGQDWRFDSRDLNGSALVLDGKVIHLCVFANDGDTEHNSRVTRISSPSQRRRNKRDRGIL